MKAVTYRDGDEAGLDSLKCGHSLKRSGQTSTW